MEKNSILDEYVRVTGVEYNETKIDDSKEVDPREQKRKYAEELYEKERLTDDEFAKFVKDKGINWGHIKDVINVSETKYKHVDNMDEYKQFLKEEKEKDAKC